MTATTTAVAAPERGFFAELREQRWDDHRYYHQSRINQTLHLISALTFLGAYVVVFFDPALAALLGWLVAMVARQSGHFFFEPKGYDHVNQTTHEHKERIKVGYNLQRKVVLHAVWIAAPLLLLASPTLWGTFAPANGAWDHARHTGLIWLGVGVGALLLRALWLAVTRSPRTGVAWVTKILTDPFHDVALYWRAPFALLRGEWIDPMHDVVPPSASRAAPGA